MSGYIVEDWTGTPFEELLQQFAGTDYRDFVKKVIELGEGQVLVNMMETMATFTEDEKRTSEELIDEFNKRGYLKSFWSCPMPTLFTEITERFAELHLARDPSSVRRSAMMRAFQLVAANFAYMACREKGFREFIGIRSRFTLQGVLDLLGIGKVRCPHCGSNQRHPRDVQREEEIRADNMSEFRKMLRMPKASARAFICQDCGHGFDLDKAVRWERMAKRDGEQCAIQMYRSTPVQHGGGLLPSTHQD